MGNVFYCLCCRKLNMCVCVRHSERVSECESIVIFKGHNLSLWDLYYNLCAITLLPNRLLPGMSDFHYQDFFLCSFLVNDFISLVFIPIPRFILKEIASRDVATLLFLMLNTTHSPYFDPSDNKFSVTGVSSSFSVIRLSPMSSDQKKKSSVTNNTITPLKCVRSGLRICIYV